MARNARQRRFAAAPLIPTFSLREKEPEGRREPRGDGARGSGLREKAVQRAKPALISILNPTAHTALRPTSAPG
jgi:hypothetical protein